MSIKAKSHSTSDSKKDDNGFLHVTAILTRPGTFEYLASEIKPQWPTNDVVQKYPDEAILIAYRPPSEVISDEYLDSTRYIPVTNDHPDDLLDGATVRKHAGGTTTHEAEVIDGRPRTGLVLWSDDLIKAYHDGKRQISVGATNTFVWAQGLTEDGKPYDFEIRNSRANHIALVNYGRAGNGARVLDAAPKSEKEPAKKEVKKMQVQFGSATFDIDDNAAKLLSQERTELQKTLDELRGKIEVLENKKPSMDDDGVKALVDAEIVKRESAKELASIRQAVQDSGHDVKDKSDDMVRGMYLALGLDKENTKDSEQKPPQVKITSDDKPKTFDRLAAKRKVYAAV